MLYCCELLQSPLKTPRHQNCYAARCIYTILNDDKVYSHAFSREEDREGITFFSLIYSICVTLISPLMKCIDLKCPVR